MRTEPYFYLEKRFAEFRKTTEELIGEARRLRQAEVEKELLEIWYRLQQGPVRALVLGTTSAGKSTLVNAASGDFVAPEGVVTTSPVPVWIKAGDSRQNSNTFVDLLERSDHPTEPTPKAPHSYLSDFCYASKAITDDQRQEQYRKYEAVRIKVDNSGVRGLHFTLIDTPGINAAVCDTERTEESIARGAEIVIFVCADPNIQTADEEFMRALLLGDTPRLSVSVSDSLFVVYNPREILGGAGSRLAFCGSAGKVFGEDFDPNAQVYMMNLRDARLASSGAYPYGEVFPAGATPADRAMYVDMAASEEELEANTPGFVKEKARTKLNGLLSAINDRADALCREPETILSPIREQIRRQWQTLRAVEADLLEKEEIPVPEELDGQRRAIQERIAAVDDQLTGLGPMYNAWDEKMRSLRTRAGIELDKMADERATAAKGRLRIFLPDAAPEEADTTKALLERLCADDWQETLLPQTMKKYRMDYYKNQQRLCAESLSRHESFCDLLQGMINKCEGVAKALRQDTPWCGHLDCRELQQVKTAQMMIQARFREPCPTEKLETALANFWAERRKIIMDTGSLKAKVRSAWEKINFDNVTYVDIFVPNLRKTLKEALKGYLDEDGIYGIYVSQARVVYADMCRMLKLYEEALRQELTDVEQGIQEALETAARNRREKLGEKYSRMDQRLEGGND